MEATVKITKGEATRSWAVPYDALTINRLHQLLSIFKEDIKNEKDPALWDEDSVHYSRPSIETGET